MMRVGVFSDSHGDTQALDELLERMGHVDAVCFLGDVESDAQHLRERLSAMPGERQFYAVRGNNDYFNRFQLPWELLIELDGVRIYMTHGHRIVSDMSLVYKAQELDARVAMFGHTHAAYCAVEHGILVLNPGSAGNYCRGGRARASVLEINHGKMKVTNVALG